MVYPNCSGSRISTLAWFCVASTSDQSGLPIILSVPGTLSTNICLLVPGLIRHISQLYLSELYLSERGHSHVSLCQGSFRHICPRFDFED